MGHGDQIYLLLGKRRRAEEPSECREPLITTKHNAKPRTLGISFPFAVGQTDTCANTMPQIDCDFQVTCNNTNPRQI
jgi:hypothetical protein